MRGIIIDDSRVMRKILTTQMAAHGFDVFEAADGRAALEKLDDIGGADLALVDWNMPVMDGYEFVVEARDEPALDSCQMMMVTTEGDEEHLNAALEAGADEYLTKPFTPEMLTDKLKILGLIQTW